jgi:anti-anti-sigma regulatory factor
MPTRITEVSTPNAQRTTLHVEGTLLEQDAELIERICRDLKSEGRRHITLDLGDLSFLDSDSAQILCRLKAEQNVSFEGLHLFIQRVIEMTEQGEESTACACYQRGHRKSDGNGQKDL